MSHPSPDPNQPLTDPERQELSRRRTHARTMQDMTALLGAGVDLQFLLPDIMVRIADSVGGRRALVLTAMEDMDALSQDIFYLMGDSQDPMAVWLPVPGSRYPEVLATVHSRKEQHLGSGGDSPRDSAIQQVLQERSLQDMVVMPLLWEREVHGVLEVWFEDPGRVDSLTLDTLRLLGAMLAHALGHSDLFNYIDEDSGLTSISMDQDDGDPALPVLGKYREFFQRAFDGIFLLDQVNRVIHLNLAGEQITGFPRRNLVGSRLTEIVVEQDRPLLTRMLSEARREGTARSFDMGLVTRAGDHVLVAVSTSAVLSEDEVVVLSFRDITEARALENELRSTKEFLERLIDSTVDAIIVTDVQDTIILFNKGAERILDAQAEDVVGQTPLARFFPEGEAERAVTLLRGAEHGGPGRLEALRTEVVNSAGGRLPVSMSASLLLEDERPVGMVVIVSDLSERINMEQRLARAQEKLVVTEKQALIAELAGTTAHELNQPLTSVMGYAELLQRTMSPDDSNLRAVSTILREAERMAEIVRKIGRITHYETKSYVGSAQILDLEKSSE